MVGFDFVSAEKRHLRVLFFLKNYSKNWRRFYGEKEKVRRNWKGGRERTRQRVLGGFRALARAHGYDVEKP